jgi:tetratricopeptide (TPR) repeat protein
MFENIYNEFAKRADFVFLMGLIFMNNALFERAITEFEKATTMKDFAVAGVNSYSAFYNIGVIYECTGHTLRAQEYYQKCGDYAPALARLGI